MVDAEPELRDRSEVFRRSVIVPATGSSYKVLSSEAYSKHGLSVSYAGMDELHAWPDRSYTTFSSLPWAHGGNR